MLNEKMQVALNDQINAEMFSSYLYLSMAAYFEAESLPGFANWMYHQADEERMHTMKFFSYINERGGRVLLQALEEPQAQWESPLAAFEAAYEHECYITARINKLVDLALQESDHPTNSFLQWFVDEQVEEEDSVDAVVQDLRRVVEFPPGVFMMDRELANRVAALAEGEAE